MSVNKDAIRYVALFEILKGTGVILISLLLFFDRGHVHKVLVEISNHLRLNLAHERNMLIAFAILYSCLRYVEGFGLWRKKKWGATMGILSVALYLPFEFYEILEHATLVKFFVTLINILLLVYLAVWRKSAAEVQFSS